MAAKQQMMFFPIAPRASGTASMSSLARRHGRADCPGGAIQASAVGGDAMTTGEQDA